MSWGINYYYLLNVFTFIRRSASFLIIIFFLGKITSEFVRNVIFFSSIGTIWNVFITDGLLKYLFRDGNYAAQMLARSKVLRSIELKHRRRINISPFFWRKYEVLGRLEERFSFNTTWNREATYMCITTRFYSLII